MATDIILTDEEVQLVGPVAGRARANSANTMALDPSNGNLRLGGANTDGDLFLTDGDGNRRVHLSAGKDTQADTVHILLDGGRANLTLGGADQDGDLMLANGAGDPTVHLSGGAGGRFNTTRILLDGNNGEVDFQDPDGQTALGINRQGKSDVLTLRGADGEEFLDANAGRVEVSTSNGLVMRVGSTMIAANANGIMIVQSGKRVEISSRDVKVVDGNRTISLADLEERVSALES